ncbi:MAG: DUF4157 domain-containing protein, partial [Planctomycetota bacterium]
TNSGLKLLAHELTHVLQQKSPPSVQRLVDVSPSAAVNDILGQFKFLCPAEKFSANASSIVSDCKSSSTQSCDCLCDVTNDPARRYSIDVHNVSAADTSTALHDGTTRIVPMPSVGPHTIPGTDPTISMPSTTGSALAFGVFDPSGQPILADNWRILGHELCGHARLNQTYTGSKGNRPAHDATSSTENDIAAEHGGSARGHFGDTRQGESFHSLPASNTELAFALVDGWHYEII